MTFVKRAVTTIIGLPAVAFIVFLGGWPLGLLLFVAAMLGLWELYKAFDIPGPLKLAGFLFTAVYFFNVIDGGEADAMLFALYMVVLVSVSISYYGKFSLDKVFQAAFGFLYVSVLLTFVLLVRNLDYGHVWVWLIFIVCFGCDTFAYLIGSAFGKRKLINSPSPSKTVEGLVGGVIGVFALGFFIPYFASRLPVFAGTEIAVFLNVWLSLAIAVFAAVGAGFSIVGDMFGSAIKRHAGIKDFGNIFPGHGGMMDRLDSIVVVAPFIFVVSSALDRRMVFFLL